MSAEPHEYMTVKELAAWLQVSTRTIERWAESEPTMPLLRIGGVIRFPRPGSSGGSATVNRAGRSQRNRCAHRPTPRRHKGLRRHERRCVEVCVIRGGPCLAG
jgi:excisionase family DNA binding protein